MEAAAGDLRFVVMPDGGCDGATWSGLITFADGRTQAIAGDRSGDLSQVAIGDWTGDAEADLIVATSAGELFGFVRQGAVFFGRDLPPAPTSRAPLTIQDGRLRVGSAVFDPELGGWR